MGQVLHGCATTTEAVRRAIQHSQESLRVLAQRYGINPKTVAKWKQRVFGRRSANRAERCEVDGALDRGGSDRRRLPPAHAPTARRLPVCFAGNDPAANPVVAAPLPAAPRHLPLTGCRKQRAE